MKRLRILFIVIAAVALMAIMVFAFTIDEITPDTVANSQSNVKYSVRVNEPVGLRFFASLPVKLREDAKLEEYGFIMTRKSFLEEKGIEDNEFGFDSDVVKVSGVSYGIDGGKMVDRYSSIDSEKVVFTSVLYNIPSDMFYEPVVARAYTKYDGKYYYGYGESINLAQAAKMTKTEGEYQNFNSSQKNVIDVILATPEPDVEEERDYEKELDKIMSSYEDVSANLFVPSTLKKPEYQDATDTWFVYAWVDNGLKYVPVYREGMNPDIIDSDTGLLSDAYAEKMCIYVEDEEGYYHIRSLGYNLNADGKYAGIEKFNSSCLDGNDDFAMFYVDGVSNQTITNVSGTRYDIGFDRLIEFGESSKILIKVYDEDVDTYEYVLYDKSIIEYMEYDEFESLAYVIYNNSTTNTREKVAVLYGEVVLSAHEELDYRIVCGYEKARGTMGEWRIFYDLFDPKNGTKLTHVPSFTSADKASDLLMPFANGTVMKVSDPSFVYDENDSDVLGVISSENLVWITGYDAATGEVSVVPCDTSLACPDCIEEHAETSGQSFKDICGNTHISNVFKTDKSFKVSKLESDVYDIPLEYAVIESVDKTDFENADTSLLCHNTVEGVGGVFEMSHAKYMKAYVSVGYNKGGIPVADYVLVMVNGDDISALNEYCDIHSTELASEFVIEAVEGPSVAGVMLSASEE